MLHEPMMWLGQTYLALSLSWIQVERYLWILRVERRVLSNGRGRRRGGGPEVRAGGDWRGDHGCMSISRVAAAPSCFTVLITVFREWRPLKGTPLGFQLIRALFSDILAGVNEHFYRKPACTRVVCWYTHTEKVCWYSKCCSTFTSHLAN